MREEYESQDLFENYLALLNAILFYIEITPEQSFRIIHNQSTMKKRRKGITPLEVERFGRTISHINFKNTQARRDFYSKKYRVPFEEMVELVEKEKEFQNA